MLNWLSVMQEAKEAGVEVSFLEDTWWGRFLKRHNVAGFNPGWHIWILSKDYGTLDGAWTVRHELTHTKQFKRWRGVSFWLGYLLPWPRIKWEIEAYKNEAMQRSKESVGYVTAACKSEIYKALRGSTYWFYGRLCPTLRWINDAAQEVDYGTLR